MGSHTTKVLTSVLTMHGVTRAKRQLPSERYHHNITLLSHWNWGSNTRYLSSILLWQWEHWLQKMHYSDAILSAMASQITGVSMVSSTVCPGAYKKTSMPRVTVPCEGNTPVTAQFPSQRANNEGNVSFWWRHHGMWCQKWHWFFIHSNPCCAEFISGQENMFCFNPKHRDGTGNWNSLSWKLKAHLSPEVGIFQVQHQKSQLIIIVFVPQLLVLWWVRIHHLETISCVRKS